MTPEAWLRTGAALMFLDVALGAFGAHALKSRLTPEMLAVFETGVRYQAYHALAILLVAALRGPDRAAWCFLGGVVLFSGSLYALALSGVRWLGAVTPFGGLSFLAGWALLAFSKLG